MINSDKVLDGEDAARLLGEEHFKAAMAAIENEAIEAAIALASDARRAEDMRLHLIKAQVARDVVQHLKSVVLTGKQVAERNRRKDQ